MNTTRKSAEFLLIIMTIGSAISFGIWMNLLNNFAIEEVSFTGIEIGILQSLREIPGFLAFTIIFVLAFIKEQRMAYIALALLGLGTMLTGLVPTNIALYLTTIIMSIGFHYFETISSSLTLQWIDKDKSAEFLGKIIASRSASSIVAFGLVWVLFELFHLDYYWIYIAGGGACLLIAIFCWRYFSLIPEKVYQTKKIVLRKRYWLYYALQFMSGARRQIFVVFAGFLMVEKFHFSVTEISLLFLVNALINIPLAPKIGRLISRIGERRSLIIEYVGLTLIFIGYALTDNAMFAVFLYILDHLFFSLAIALKTYFQKIADPADIASSAGLTFTINHIAAVFVPVIFGMIWIYDYSFVFYAGSLMAITSLAMALNMPRSPAPGNEVLVGKI
ncbi:MAG TPA: MFS transporter [Candidatus Thioglobus sp.]|nr:MFS transporter [Candidatus Thioglobus sp.]HIL42518.1 MFS transporter [Gammaproteobacteria bacterium]